MLIMRALRLTDGFTSWSDAQLQQLAARSALRRYERGQMLPLSVVASREARLVVSGFIEVSRVLGSGRKFVYGIRGPGTVLGIINMFEDEANVYGYDFYAHEDAAMVHIPADPLLAILDEDPALWRHMGRMVLRFGREGLRAFMDQIVGETRPRIAATLQRLAELYGVQGEDGLQVRLRLSQDDLAAMLGVSRQTVNKELRALESENLIRSDYTAITVLDLPALRRLAGAAP